MLCTIYALYFLKIAIHITYEQHPSRPITQKQESEMEAIKPTQPDYQKPVVLFVVFQ